jgi:NTE family protein
MKYLLFALLVLFLICPVNLKAQKVGVVLSGGGAKGYAHVGLLKALEENHIPIDYICGTSIGAIVGGLYAIG